MIETKQGKRMDTGKQLARELYADLEERPRFESAGTARCRTCGAVIPASKGYCAAHAPAKKVADGIAQRATTETRHEANRRKAAKKMADAMRKAGVSPAEARLGGLYAADLGQKLAQDAFRCRVAEAARTHDGRIPEDATFELACDLLEFAEEVSRG